MQPEPVDSLMQTSMAIGQEVPRLLWDLAEEEEDLLYLATRGLLTNEDPFLGSTVLHLVDSDSTLIDSPPLSPRQPPSVAFVEPSVEETGHNDAMSSEQFFLDQAPKPLASSSNNVFAQSHHPQQQQQQHISNHFSSQMHEASSWFDSYVDVEAFGGGVGSSSAKNLSSTSNFQQQQSTSGHHHHHDFSSGAYEPNGSVGFFNTSSANNFQHQQQQQNNDLMDHQMQDLSAASSSTFHFAQLNIQEPTTTIGIDPSQRPPIPESEYSASYSAPGSAYSTDDWSTASEHSSAASARSQDEILDEIQRECAEIERKSASPVASSSTTAATVRERRHKPHTKRRSNVAAAHRVSPSASRARVAASVNAAASDISVSSGGGGGGNSDRKKELNRIAATKYREKKRRERELLALEHHDLESRNAELRSTLKSLKTEVNYLRKLMRDMEARAQSS